MADDPPKSTKAMANPNAVPKPVQIQERREIDFTSLSFDDLLTHIRFRDLETLLEKIHIFLQSCDEELEFPTVYKACEEILVRIVKDVNVLKCPKMPSKCCYFAKQIMRTINSGADQKRFIVVCTYRSEKRDQTEGLRAKYDNILVYKRIFYKKMSQPKPKKKSSSSQESRSSSEESDTSRSNILEKNKFISHCLELILDFVKDNDQLNLEFTDLNQNDSNFLHTFLSSIIECNFDKKIGGKNVLTSIREAVRIFSLKYDFNIRYVDFKNGIEKKSLLLEKKAKSENQPKTELPSTDTKLPPQGPQGKPRVKRKEREKAALSKVVHKLSSEFLTHTLKKMYDFLSDDTAASVAFLTIDPVEKRFLKSIPKCVNSHHMHFSLDHEVQRLVEQIQGLLKENIDYKLSHCVRQRGGDEKEVIYSKVPKFDGPIRLSRSWYPPSHDSKVPGINQHSEWSTSSSLPVRTAFMSKMLGYSPKKFKTSRVNKDGNNAAMSENVKDKALIAALNNRTDYMEPILIQGELWLERMKEIQNQEAVNEGTQSGEPQTANNDNEVQSGEGQNAENKSGEGEKAENKIEESQNTDNKSGEGQKAENKSGEGQNADNKNGESQNTDSKIGEGQNTDNKSGESQINPVPIATSNKIGSLKRAITTLGYGAVAKRNVQLMEAMSVPVQSEKAIRMMKSMGWKGGPLGSKENGIAEPIVPQINTGKAGLGHVSQKSSPVHLPKPTTSAAPSVTNTNKGSILGPVPLDQLLLYNPVTVILPPVQAASPVILLPAQAGSPVPRTPNKFRQTVFTQILNLMRSNCNQIAINFNPPLKKRETCFLKYIVNALAKRQKVALEPEHKETLDAITAEYQKNTNMVVTACCSNNKREVILKKVNNHSSLLPKLNKKEIRDMQTVDLSEEATNDIQAFMDQYGSIWRNKRNNDKLTFKLEFFFVILAFVRNVRESFLKVEFVSELNQHQGRFLLTFFENVNKKMKFGSTVPEITLTLRILKYLNDYEIVLGCFGDDYVTAFKKYIRDKPSTSDDITINNNLNTEETQDYTYRFIKQFYYGDPNKKDVADETDDSMIPNTFSILNYDIMPRFYEENAQFDEKTDKSDEKTHVSDDIISISSKDSKATNADDGKTKNDNKTECVDEMSVSDYSAYTDYYSDDAEDMSTDDYVIKLCDDDDIIKISDDEELKVRDRISKMDDDKVKIVDEEMKIVDEEVKMVDCGEKTVDEEEVVDKEVKIGEDNVKMVDDSIKMVDDNVNIVEDGIKMVVEKQMVDDKVKMVDEKVKIVDEKVKMVDEDKSEVEVAEKRNIIDEREIVEVEDTESAKIDNEVKMPDDGVKIVDVGNFNVDDNVKMADNAAKNVDKVKIVDEGLKTVTNNDFKVKDDAIKVVDDSKLIDRDELIIGDDIKGNEENLDQGLVNIENVKINLAGDDDSGKTAEDNGKTGDDKESDEETDTTADNGIKCDKMLDISLKSESLKAMLNIDVTENQSEIEISENDVKIVYLSKHYFLSKDIPSYIQGLISLNIMHTKQLPLLKCHGVQDGALVYSCHTKKSYDWLNTICVANNIYMETKEFDKMRLKINSFFKFDEEYFFNMLEMYNRELSTKDWVILLKQDFDNHVIFDIKMDAKSFKFILDSNMELYAGIDKVTFDIIYV